MHDLLGKLAETVVEKDGLAPLVYDLLEMLEAVTHLESTFFTRIDMQHSQQHVIFARNSRALEIPEGLATPWKDTLCQCALGMQDTFTDDITACWGDLLAARTLGIRTFLSEPIFTADGMLYGTLCAASRQSIPLTPKVRRLVKMFSGLIALQIDREHLLERLQQENHLLQTHALTDLLTGIFNRRAMESELRRALMDASRAGDVVHLAFIDLDGFKQINDRYGHDTGDRFLIEMARRLKEGVRETDVVARIGGDEFVIFGFAGQTLLAESQRAMAEHIEHLTHGVFDLGTVLLDYPGASVGMATSWPDEKDTEALLNRADSAMYQVKQARRRIQSRRPTALRD